MSGIAGLKRVGARSDVWVGLFFALLGGAVLFEASGFEGTAARMPVLCGILLLSLGTVLTLRTAFAGQQDVGSGGLLKTIVVGPLPAAILLLVWVYLMAQGFGFFVVGVPFVMGVVYLMGHRRLARSLLSSLAIVGVVFVVFYVVFNVPLPVSPLVASVFGSR